jgi:signal transduction histidine kinase
MMPSALFQELALSQLELLASSMQGPNGASKIRSMALYLPQENAKTGQLEFSPAVVYPHPMKERVFIANDSDSGVAPTLPMILTKLPGFAHAASLIPGYPMVSMSGNAGVGEVEEVLCDLKNGATALSVPLFAGSQTVGVLLATPSITTKRHNGESMWTERDQQQVAKAAKSLSLALSMDTDRSNLRAHNQRVQDALSDSLHQVKNPLQALRTYGKLLQRRMSTDLPPDMTPQIFELADHLMVQSDRLVERLKPVDAIVEAMTGERRPPALNPVEAKALVPFQTPMLPAPDENYTIKNGKMRVLKGRGQRQSNATITFGFDTPARNDEPRRVNSTVTEFTVQSPSIPAQTDDTVAAAESQSGILMMGDTELEMSFVTDVLDPIFSAFQALAEDRGISFRVVAESDDLPGVIIWPKALQEAVINLLDNAFKYVSLRKGRGKPQIRVRYLPNRWVPGVTILIEDNGPGIARENRESVFERGVRATEQVDGSGLGLTIARSLVEAMGGTVRVVDKSDYFDALDGAILELSVFRKRKSR